LAIGFWEFNSRVVRVQVNYGRQISNKGLACMTTPTLGFNAEISVEDF